MVPIVTQLAADFDGRALVGTVDVTTQASLPNAYAVSAVPTFVLFKGGREVSRIVGTATYAELAGQLQTLLAAS
jgi:thioredoxin 1